MPIPIAQIPNAPQVGPDPALTQVPRVNTNLAGVAQNLMQPGLQQGAYDGPAKGAQAFSQGLENLGESTAKIQTIVEDSNHRRARYQDSVGLAEYSAKMSAAFEKHKGTLPGTSENEWVPNWHSKFDIESAKALDGVTLSADGIRELNLLKTQFYGQTTTELTTSSIRSAFNRGNGEILAQAQSYHDNGNDTNARSTLRKLVGLGAMSAADAEQQIRTWDFQRNTERLTAAMQQNPVLFRDDIRDFIKTGESVVLAGSFKGPDKAIQLQKWERIASSYVDQLQTDQRKTVFEQIQAGGITDEYQINKAISDGGGVLTELDQKAFKKSLLNTVGVLDLGKYNDILGRVMQYDLKADPRGEVRAGLEREIGSELPTAEGQMLFKRLRGITSGQGNTDADQRVSQISKQFFDSGVFGQFISGNRADYLTGEALQKNRDAESKAQLARARFDDAWLKYSAQNPGMSVEDAAKWAYARQADSLRAQKAAEPAPEPNSWSPFNWFSSWSHKVQGPTPQAAQDFIEQKKASMPAASPSPEPGKAAEPMPGSPSLPEAKAGGSADVGSVDDNTVSMVKQWEDFNPNAYADYKQTSIGYGTRAKDGETSITKDEADKRLREELSMHARRVDEALAASPLQLNSNQRAALISFDFNTGEGVKLIRTSDDVDEIAGRIALYTKVTENGRKVQSKGLVNRRTKELALFNS